MQLHDAPKERRKREKKDSSGTSTDGGRFLVIMRSMLWYRRLV